MAKSVATRKTRSSVPVPVEMTLPQKILKLMRSGRKYTWEQLSKAVGEDIDPRRLKLMSEMIAAGALFHSIKVGTVTVAVKLINHESFDRNGQFIRRPGRQPKGPFYHEVYRTVPLPY